MTTNNIFQQENFTAQNGDYTAATRKGFEFGREAGFYEKLTAKQEQAQEKMEGKEHSSFRIVLSFLGIFVALVLGAVESSNISMTLVAIGNFGETMALVVATGFVCMGLIIGEELNAGLVKNEYSNKREPTARFWGAVLIGLIYLGIQIFLSLQAGHGGAADMQSDVIYMIIFSLLVSIAEIAFGFIFLRVAISSISLFILKLRLRLSLKRLNTLAKAVENLWNRYVFIMQKAGVQPAEPTDAVKRARDFYAQGGFPTSNDSSETE